MNPLTAPGALDQGAIVLHDTANLAQGNGPLNGLPRTQVMGESGYFVDGGLSPFSIAFLKPADQYVKEQHPGESIFDYVSRMQEQDIDVKTFVDRLRPTPRVPLASAVKKKSDARWPKALMLTLVSRVLSFHL